MSVDREKLKALLEWYRQEVGDDLIAAIIVNREGLIMDAVSGTSGKSVEEDIVGGVSALVEPVLNRITKEFSSGSFGTGTFDTDEYRLIFCEAGAHAVFVTVLDAIAMVDPIFPVAYLTAEKISRIFDGRPVSPVIPNIISSQKDDGIERKVDKLQKITVKSGEYAFKLILGGDGAVGKTSMVHRFVEDSFKSDYKGTIGTSIMKKQCSFDDLKSSVRFVIWDLAGQTQFRRVRQTYLANAEAGILVFDVTRKETFENIRQWHDEIIKASKNISLILVGNKIDLVDERDVFHEEGEGFANELNISYIETSAKTGENINEAFKMLALQMIKRFIVTEEV
ncbi:MAG: GTP-binding protein [Candidatus Lokiarchaeota archaeon]|nr:GTP-binding protein [Candidatus Lokiarchaeota archaeon]MBD3200578.1 GTP-binding protein [Candidatus Lokiarchaeota archaeon]